MQICNRSMQKFDGILKHIIIEIFVEMEQEGHADFLGINYFLDSDCAVFAISVSMVSLNNS